MYQLMAGTEIRFSTHLFGIRDSLENQFQKEAIMKLFWQIKFSDCACLTRHFNFTTGMLFLTSIFQIHAVGVLDEHCDSCALCFIFARYLNQFSG